jgi:hypothetical protein
MSNEILCLDGTQYQISFFDELAKIIFGETGRAVTQSNDPALVFFSYCGYEYMQYVDTKPLVFVACEPDSCATKPYDLLIDCKHAPHLRRANKPYVYYPFSLLSFSERREHNLQHLMSPTSPTSPCEILDKPLFCAFMYAQEVNFRNQLFDQISTYKYVSPLGKCRNPNYQANTSDRTLYTPSISFYDTAVQKYKPFKFVICCENSRFDGYITEKIINARLASAIPIYLGAPDVIKYINPSSFIDASKPNFMDHISLIDSNDEARLAMLNAPFLVQLPLLDNVVSKLQKLHYHWNQLRNL